MFFTTDNNGNVKALNSEALPDSAWQWYSGKPKEDDIMRLYGVVSWMYRCIRIIENGIRTMPFTVERGGDTVVNFDGASFDASLPPDLTWLGRFPRNAGMIASAGQLMGEAYLERRYALSNSNVIGYDWLLPSSITPEIDEATGEPTSFKRTLKNKQITLTPEYVVWFWPPDFGVETGPAKYTPGRAVMANAGVLNGMDIFLSGYFKRGMIKATLLTYKESLLPGEAERTKSWWRRTLSGLGGAHNAEVVRGDFAPISIGEGIKDLRDNALTDSEREAIAVGFGIPLSKLNSNIATDANRVQDDKQFINDVLTPEATWIYEAVNAQMMPDGYTIKAQPQRLEPMQVEENDRTSAYVALVKDAGMPPETAVALLGIDIPENMPLTTPQAPTAVAMNEMRAAEIITEKAQFKRWYKSRIGQAWDDFTPQHLTADDIADIAAEMNQAEAQKAMMAQQAQRAREFNQALDFFTKALESQPPTQPTPISFTLAPELKPTPVTVQNDFVVDVPEQKAGEIVVNVPPAIPPDVVVNVPETAVNVTNNVDVAFPKRAQEVTNVTRDSQGFIVRAETETEYDND